MADKDPAFMWETEALRSAPQRATEEELDEETADSERWVTLRQASRATGIPVETLRKWARRGTVPTFLQPTNLGTNLRLVDLDGVQRRAAELGRSSGSAPAAMPSPVDEPAPPGTMIVPVDAWNKMLSQLGNLHEAGQQLAAARERAVKAETEALFLRERLAEMRQEREAPQPAVSPESGDASEPTPTGQPEASPPPEKVWQYLIRRARAGRIRDDASG